MLELSSLVSHSAGCSEVREELVTQANNKIPDVSCHLRSCNENSPDEDYKYCIEAIPYVPQPRDKSNQEKEKKITSVGNLRKLANKNITA